jgi:hypothetical protein
VFSVIVEFSIARVLLPAATVALDVVLFPVIVERDTDMAALSPVIALAPEVSPSKSLIVVRSTRMVAPDARAPEPGPPPSVESEMVRVGPVVEIANR